MDAAWHEALWPQEVVAEIWHSALTAEFEGVFARVVFAIRGAESGAGASGGRQRSPNLEAFAQRFGLCDDLGDLAALEWPKPEPEPEPEPG